MIAKIAEINKVLIAVESVYDKKSGAEYSSVLDQCDSTIIEGLLPDNKLSLEFTQTIGLITIKKRKIFFTEEGKNFLEFNPDRVYDLSLDQKRLLIRTCYLHGPLKPKIWSLIKLFSPNYEENTFKLSISKNNLDEDLKLLIEHLIQLGFFIRDANYISVNSDYVDATASFISEGKGWPEESLEVYLRERREVGNIAEELALKYEKERLGKKRGCAVESMSVRQISKLRVDAGYDLESFDGKTPGLNFDRFIEVKGAKDKKLKFFWSENEMKVAKKLKERYWIYFQGGINVSSKSSNNEIILIQNPIEKILKDPSYKKTPQGIIVEGNFVGKFIQS